MTLPGGFTGTQKGITTPQREALITTIINSGVTELHHGACIGADEAAHHAFLEIYPYGQVVVHPPSNTSKQSTNLGGGVYITYRTPAPYLERNHNIVNETKLLIACPNGPEELRSGTWATVRYARKLNRLIYLVMPDGTVLIEWPTK